MLLVKHFYFFISSLIIALNTCAFFPVESEEDPANHHGGPILTMNIDASGYSLAVQAAFLSRIQTGTYPEGFDPSDMPEALKEVIDQLTPSINSNPIGYILEMDARAKAEAIIPPLIEAWHQEFCRETSLTDDTATLYQTHFLNKGRVWLGQKGKEIHQNYTSITGKEPEKTVTEYVINSIQRWSAFEGAQAEDVCLPLSTLFANASPPMPGSVKPFLAHIWPQMLTLEEKYQKFIKLKEMKESM